MSRPGVVFGGPSPEHDVSILTGLQAARALTQAGHEVEAIYWTKSGDFYRVEPTLEAQAFLNGVPQGARELRLVASPGGGFVFGKAGLLAKTKPLELSAVLNCCHGGPGEDGTLQAAFDLAGLPYSGPDVAAASLSMDKLEFASLVRSAGLPSLERVPLVADPRRPEITAPEFAGPYIVKPRFGGSSIGIQVVNTWSDALSLVSSGGPHWRRGAIVEPYRGEAADINVAVRTWPEPQLSLIERPIRSGAAGEILGYEDKYLGGEGMVSAERELPAQLPDTVVKGIQNAALIVAALLPIRGVARLDFLVDGDQWWVNELNAIPGSLAKYLWVEQAAVPFPTLLADMLDEATAKPAARWDATGADGLALRSAAAIASKLG